MAFTERMRKSVYEGGLSGKAPSAFRRVHYELIAATISHLKPDIRARVAEQFALTFISIGGFDRARSLKACGV